MALGSGLFINLPALENKKYAVYTLSMEMIHMAKSRPRKNDSERSGLPQEYLAIQ